MAKNKYSELLQDAYMVNDVEAIEKYKDLIALDGVQQKTVAESYIIGGNKLLENSEASIKSIIKFMDNEYGKDWEEDEIETIDKILWVEHNVVLTGPNRDKVLGIRSLKRGELSPYSDWYTFNNMALALGGSEIDTEFLRTPTPGMLINSVTVMSDINPDEVFDISVIDYITSALIGSGVSVPPRPLAGLIAESMAHASSVPLSSWSKVNEMLTSGEVDETMEGIQASRIMSAEEASKIYYSEDSK